MQVGQGVVGCRRDDREGAPNGVRVRVVPTRPQARDCERPPIIADDPVWLADRPFALPLVERVERYEAAPPLEGHPERGARGQGLSPGVEHPRATLEVRGPVRDEPPPIGGDRSAVLALHDDERVIGRGDVEPGAQLVGERLRGEDLGELGRRPLLGEPSAHRVKSSIVAAHGRRPATRHARPVTQRAPVAHRGRRPARCRRRRFGVGRLPRRRGPLLAGRGFR